jgi:hypothetical protein
MDLLGIGWRRSLHLQLVVQAVSKAKNVGFGRRHCPGMSRVGNIR